MIALDTNVLVRLVIGDDPEQAEAVGRLLSAPGETFFIADLVLAELAWVLTGRYGFTRPDVVEVLSSLLNRADVVFEDEDRIRSAVRRYSNGLDLADGLILGRAKAAGCSRLATFDDSLLRRDPAFVRRPE